jgi:hypothetical protein
MSAGRAARRASTDRRALAFSALTFWTLGFVLVVVVLATVAAWPVYETPRALVVGLVGGVVGMGVAVLARVLRWGALFGALAAVGVYVLVAVPLAVPSALSSGPALLGGLRDAVLGVVLGWKQMLTLSPPLGEYQAVLIPFLVVMLAGGFLATLLGLHPGRRAALAVPVVIGMTVFGIAFGPSSASATLPLGVLDLPAPREWLVGVGVFLAGVTWLIGRARIQRAQALRIVAAENVSRRAAPVWLRIRRHLLAGGLVVVALVAGLAVAPVAAGWADRSVLRDGIEPMIVVQEQSSPLGAYRAWFAGDRLDEPVFEVQGDTGSVDRIRLVTLDAYDGNDFHISADDRFSRLPRSAPPATGRVELDITIGDAYRGIWVPAPAGLAEAPDFAGSRADALADGFHIDDDGDTAITVAETSGGGSGLVPGDRYSVLVDPPADTDGITALKGGDSALDADDYPMLVEWAEMQEQPRTGAGFAELVDRLRSRGYLSHAILDDSAAAGWIAGLQESEGYAFAPSYAGHSAARVEELFASMVEQERRAGSDAAPELLVSAVGDDEQFAAATALLARHWGLESRVVLGTRLAGAEEVPGIPACTEVCTGENMTAWVEVRASGGDWSPIDVTPQFAMLPSAITEGEQLPEHPTVPEQPRSEALDPPQAQSDSNDDAPPLEAPEGEFFALLLPILRAVGLSALALLLLALPLLVLVFAKGHRARTRRAAVSPEVRLSGAWEELVDLYADHDIEMADVGTRVQRAASTDRGAAARLAAIVDRGVFAGHPPTDADADEAWAIVDAEHARLTQNRTRRQRLLARLRPGSFVSRARMPWTPGFLGGRRAVGTLALAGSPHDRQKGNS